MPTIDINRIHKHRSQLRLFRCRSKWSRSYVTSYSNLTIISLCRSWSICFLIIHRRCYYFSSMRNSIRPCYLSCWLQWCWNTTILDCEKLMGYIMGIKWLCLYCTQPNRNWCWYLRYCPKSCFPNYGMIWTTYMIYIILLLHWLWKACYDKDWIN